MSHCSGTGFASGGNGGEYGGAQMFHVPMPMAMVGMCIAFMFGCTIGMLVGKKHGMQMGGGMHHRMGRHGGHHHHGYGMPPCGCGSQAEMYAMEPQDAEE
jgi:hypothetical protein